MRKNKKYAQLFSLITYLNANWYLLKHCRLTIFSWVSFPILEFLDQQEKFTSPTTCVTKFTLAVNAGFIRKILCFEVLKALFSQLVDRMLKNKSLNE